MDIPPDPDLDEVVQTARQRRIAQEWEERRAEREAEIDELLRALLEPGE